MDLDFLSLGNGNNYKESENFTYCFIFTSNNLFLEEKNLFISLFEEKSLED